MLAQNEVTARVIVVISGSFTSQIEAIPTIRRLSDSGDKQSVMLRALPDVLTPSLSAHRFPPTLL